MASRHARPCTSRTTFSTSPDGEVRRLILAVVALLFHLVGKLILRIFKAVDLGWFNWILGILFSLLKAALIIGLVLVLFDTLNLKFELVKPETLDQSVLYAPIRDAAYKVFPYLKALLFKQ